MKTSFKKHRFMGLSLGGGKSSRTHLAVVDYFPSENKVFLTHLLRDLGEDGKNSADAVLVNLICGHQEDLEYLAIDAPLTSPPCLDCGCKGFEHCKNESTRWMWDHYHKQHSVKRPHKIFTPYTERAVEQYLSTALEIDLPVDHALGANRAPMWARMVYLKRILKGIKLLEVFPRLNTWRIGRPLKISKTPLVHYKHSVDGVSYRQIIVDKLLDSEWLFIYAQDAKHMVKDAHVFEAVLSAYTGFLHFKKLSEKPPKGFPASGGWVTFPRPDFPQGL